MIYHPTIFVNRLTKILKIDSRQIDDVPETELRIEEITTTTNVYKKSNRTFKHSIYFYEKETNNKDIIIVSIPGGAFMSSFSNLNIYTKMPNLKYNVADVEYPTVPYARFNEMLECIKNSIKKILETYKMIFLTGYSAGAYLAVHIATDDELIPYIKKFVGVSGYYGMETVSDNKMIFLADCLYLTTYKNRALFKASPLSMDSLYICGSKDPLKSSTINYIKQFNGQDVYLEYEGNHVFYLHYNTEETKQFYKDYISFLETDD